MIFVLLLCMYTGWRIHLCMLAISLFGPTCHVLVYGAAVLEHVVTCGHPVLHTQQQKHCQNMVTVCILTLYALCWSVVPYLFIKILFIKITSYLFVHLQQNIAILWYRTHIQFFCQYKRSFPVVGADLWNELPADITSAPLLPVFRQRLKTFLFRRSYPGIVV